MNISRWIASAGAITLLLSSNVAQSASAATRTEVGIQREAIGEVTSRQLDGTATPHEVASALRRAGAKHVLVRAEQPDVTISRVPSNAFSVRTMWADFTGTDGKKHLILYGMWNFRDNFVGSGAPRDVSAVAVSGFKKKCWTQVSDSTVYKDYKGRVRGKGTRHSAGHQKSIRSINDRTSSHMLFSDNGIHQIEMRKDKSGKKKCGGRKAGSYYFEHSQGGNGGWSASVSVAAFSVNYSGSGGQTLRKAAKYSYYN